MSKLSFEALSQRAESVTSQELLNSISGGTENACHDGPTSAPSRAKIITGTK